MVLPLLFAGAAATYLHKKFPKATESAASGFVTATIWTLKTAGRAALKAADSCLAAKVEVK